MFMYRRTYFQERKTKMKHQLLMLIISVLISTSSQATIFTRSFPYFNGKNDYDHIKHVEFDLDVQFSSISSAKIELTAQGIQALGYACFSNAFDVFGGFNCADYTEFAKALFTLGSGESAVSSDLVVDHTRMNTTSIDLPETDRLLDGRDTLYFSIKRLEFLAESQLTRKPVIFVNNVTLTIDGVLANNAAPTPIDTDPIDISNALPIITGKQAINHKWQLANKAFNRRDTVIFFSAPTINGAQRGIARMRKTAGGTQFRFQEWSNLDGRHTNETIKIIGMPTGKWLSNDNQIEVGVTEISGTGRWKTIRFASKFQNPPAVVLNLQSANGNEAADVHVRNITTESMEIALFEQENRMRSGHAQETAGYLLIDSNDTGFNLNNAQSTRIELPFQSTGINVNHNWTNLDNGTQIRLEEDQTADREILHVEETVHVININGIYLTQISSANGGDPAVLRSRILK